MEWPKKEKRGKIIYKALDRTKKIEQHELGEGEVGYSGRINSSLSNSVTRHKWTQKLWNLKTWVQCGFSGVRVARSLVFCVMFCRSLFVLLSCFFLPLCCLSFLDLRFLINSLVSSNFSYRRSETHFVPSLASNV